MERKYQTLKTIYELVKNDAQPTMSIIQPNEIIIRQELPWDIIVDHLKQLEAEKHITLQQVSTAVISITAKGLHYISAVNAGSAA